MTRASTSLSDYEPFDRMAAAVDAQLSGAALQGRAATQGGCPPSNFFPFFLGCIARTDPEAARGIISIFEMALFDHAEDMQMMEQFGRIGPSVNPVVGSAGDITTKATKKTRRSRRKA